MAVCIVGKAFYTQDIKSSQSGIHFDNTFIDPMDDVRGLLRLWGEYGVEKHMSIGEIENSFWCRQDFMATLNNLADDVYIRFYNHAVQMLFASADDHIIFDNICRESKLWNEFPSELKPCIQEWIKQHHQSIDHKWISMTNGKVRIAFRDPYFRTLVTVKFSNTKPEDHHNLIKAYDDDEVLF